MGETKEPFPSNATVVQGFFAFEQQIEPLAKFTRLILHDVMQRVIEQTIATNGNSQLTTGGIGRTQITKLTDLMRETTFVIRTGLFDIRRWLERQVSRSGYSEIEKNSRAKNWCEDLRRSLFW